MTYPWYIQLLLSLIPSFVVAVITAHMTVKLSLRRFYTERWWEKKADVYSRIVDALHKHKKYAQNKLNNEFVENPDTSKDKRLEQQWLEGKKELEHAVDLGAFIISEESEMILQKFLERKLPDFREVPFYEIIETDIKHVQECLTEIKSAAKRDLRL